MDITQQRGKKTTWQRILSSSETLFWLSNLWGHPVRYFVENNGHEGHVWGIQGLKQDAVSHSTAAVLKLFYNKKQEKQK